MMVVHWVVALVLGVVAVASGGAEAGAAGVVTGAQRLAEDEALRHQMLTGRVGIISNPTGILNNLTHVVDYLAGSDTNLVAIFGPEHGFRGDHQAGRGSADVYTDNRTGLPVYSLYRKQGEKLAQVLETQRLDTLVFDIQDVGCRFYTYIWTLWDVMEALPSTRIRNLVVLDRPNPIGAHIVQGPVLEKPFASFIGRYAIPLRHGMTVAELANLFFDAQHPHQQQPATGSQKHRAGNSSPLGRGPLRSYNVSAVTMLNYRRDMLYDDTRVPWVPPSPNMPTLATALVYPGLGILEGTNLSEGRGTTTPFNVFGAGFFNYTFVDNLRRATAPSGTGSKGYEGGDAAAASAATASLSGHIFAGGAVRETYFVPTFSKFMGNVTSGAELYVLDRDAFNPIAWGLAVVQEGLRASSSTSIHDANFDLHLGNNATRLMLTNGTAVPQIVASWQPALQAFEHTRQRFLLY